MNRQPLKYFLSMIRKPTPEYSPLSNLRELLGIPEQYEILLALALGKPAETVVIEPMPPDGNINYRRDEQSVHHVPKRSLSEIILNLEKKT